jgi:hypothetical protein
MTRLTFFPSNIVGYFAVSLAARDFSFPEKPPYKLMPDARFTTVESVVSP